MVLVYDEIRQTRDSLRYGYAVGKVRVLETRALDRSALERLLDARTFPEQKRLLSETAYARYLETAETPQEVERALDDTLDGFYRFLEDAALPESVVRFFRVRYDYANLKAALKSGLLGTPLDGLLVNHGTLPAAAFLDGLSELPEPLAGLVAAVADHTDTAAIDAQVDRAYFADLAETARSTRSRFLTDLAALFIDVANVKTLVRGRLAGKSAERLSALFFDGGTVSPAGMAELAEHAPEDLAGALRRHAALRPLAEIDLADTHQLDPALEGLMAAALRRGRHEAAGPEPVIAYVMGREAEVRMLRVLLLGTLTGIGYETLRARLSAAVG